MYHNAGKLTLVWKILNIGLTVESSDIVHANPVFMVMLVAQLYKVLPSLHPRFQIYFASSLSTGIPYFTIAFHLAPGKENGTFGFNSIYRIHENNQHQK